VIEGSGDLLVLSEISTEIKDIALIVIGKLKQIKRI
jgi:hypothetical protein